jgi:hypothetical protein
LLETTLGSTDNKVRPQSGSTNLGQGVTFSIPQFGDFFHDMVCRTRLTPFQSSVLMTPIQSFGTATTPSPFPANGFFPDGTGPAVAGVVPTNAAGYPAQDAAGNPLIFYNLVDAFGNRLVQGVGVTEEGLLAHDPVQYRNLVRYCEYPGNRLFQDVKFDVNGNPLDEYDDIVPVFLTKFCLAPNKIVGFKRLVGQEVPLEGYGSLRTSAVVDLDAINTPQNINLAYQGHGFALFNNPPPGAFGNGQGDSSAAADYLAGLTPTTGPPFTAAPRWWDDNWPSSGGQLNLPWTSTPALNPAVGAGAITGSYPNAVPGATHPLPPFGNFAAAGGVGPIPFAALNSSPAPVVDISRELKAIVDGPQTPKPAQPPLEVWNKLRFWFNDDVRLSIASVSIPFGQRFITIELAEHHQLAFEFPNLYLETITEVMPVIGADGTGSNTSQRIVSYEPIFQQGVPDGPNVERMELYVNNIFVNPEVNHLPQSGENTRLVA